MSYTILKNFFRWARKWYLFCCIFAYKVTNRAQSPESSPSLNSRNPHHRKCQHVVHGWFRTCLLLVSPHESKHAPRSAWGTDSCRNGSTPATMIEHNQQPRMVSSCFWWIDLWCSKPVVDASIRANWNQDLHASIHSAPNHDKVELIADCKQAIACWWSLHVKWCPSKHRQCVPDESIAWRMPPTVW